ncbi:hypothetical protein TSTA_063890 [Talaromyces stipitatus ATCC 10500]|uniref:Protein kinase domain-containing protein n=1 Tax=Talaromyces stipitatus (strain ATCC 10500 / CBS 375.48 / QM 6759 / NRRL 1006) TaxID=441959 RepID=B8LYI5_TALSN|nr:uncharacterized protein TSTA_063890 [Talaromyces stipitatus ATCC 10500]EED22914.1 hypothetical protein TSTA_063890 [Talaromyces stipitatus ATCC 10500]
MEVPNIPSGSGKRNTYSLDQDVEFQSKDDKIGTPREDTSRIYNSTLRSRAVFLLTLRRSFPKGRQFLHPMACTDQGHQPKSHYGHHITCIRSCSADELGKAIEIPKHRDNEAGVSYFGKYNENMVFVHEKKNFSPLKDTLTRLTWQLRLSENIKELRILLCLGYTIDLPLPERPSLTQEYIHHVIYAIPGKHVISLRDMLSLTNIHQFQSSLSRTMRFEIAQSLARSILYLHTAEWLHRGTRSSNVLFCSDVDFPDTHQRLSPPYLAGFDYTYLPSDDEIMNAKVQTGFKEWQLYRHPNVLREPTTWLDAALGDNDKAFSKNHDICGLGVILVELGVCKSAARLWKKSSRDKCNGESKCQRYLITELIPEVSSIMGSKNADVA